MSSEKPMIMITEKHISQLLFEHDCVIVPGLGGFIVNYAPAFIHPVHHTFSPPSTNLAFNAGLRNNDGLLANSIKIELGISFHEAMEIIEGEVAELKSGMHSGNRLNLEKIGILYEDRENNIQFTPEPGVNYNSDAFGLTTFNSPSIKRAGLQEKISRKLMPQQAVRSSRLLPATLKWAAVLLPLATIALWSALNTEKVNGIYNNYASLFPSADSNTETGYTRPSGLKPTRIITPAERTEMTAAPAPAAEVETTVQPVAPDVYFIITGAFSVEENAQRLVEELKNKGFGAGIAGQTSSGLYRVSVQGYSDKDIALQHVQDFRNGDFPNAWLLIQK